MSAKPGQSAPGENRIEPAGAERTGSDAKAPASPGSSPASGAKSPIHAVGAIKSLPALHSKAPGGETNPVPGGYEEGEQQGSGQAR